MRSHEKEKENKEKGRWTGIEGARYKKEGKVKQQKKREVRNEREEMDGRREVIRNN
jgi:hypothetical protein